MTTIWAEICIYLDHNITNYVIKIMAYGIIINPY